MVDCQHSWQTVGATSAVAHTFEDWQGLVSGLVQCGFCGAPAILTLLAWRGAGLKQRIYSIAELPVAATEVFMRNMQSAYCDLTRQQHEVEALTNLGRIQEVSLFTLPALTCQKTISITNRPDHRPWQEIKTDEPQWWSLFEV